MVAVSLPDRVKRLIHVLRDEGPVCCSKARSVGRRKKSLMTDFLFVQHRDGNTVNVSSIVMSAITSLGTAAIAGSAIGPAAAVAACVPIIVPVTNQLVDAGIPIGDEAKNSMAHLVTTNYLQLSFGLIEFLSGDIVNGVTHMVMAGVGFYVVSVDGIVLLPSYSVATSVFAGVSAVDLVQMLLQKGALNGDIAMTQNLMRFTTIAHPFLYAASAYLAWNLIEQLRAGLLRNATASQTEAPGAAVMLEPSVPVGSRQPFVGRAFRLGDELHHTQPQVPLNNDT